MAPTTFLALKDKQDPLVISALDYAVLLHPWESGCPYMPDDLTDGAGVLQALPAGWQTSGEIQKKAGVDITPDTKTSPVEGYGSAGPRRTIVTGEDFTIDYTAQEWRKINQEIYYGTDLSSTNAAPGLGWTARKTSELKLRYYSALVIASDTPAGSDMYPFWKFGKVSVTKRNRLSGQSGSELGFPLTLTIFEDSAWGALFDFGVAGAGFDDIAVAAGFALEEVVPTILSHTPSGSFATAGGELLILNGSAFTGTTGVTVGGTAAADFQIINDSTLSVITPAKSAGAYNVIVTNAEGPSAGHSITFA